MEANPCAFGSTRDSIPALIITDNSGSFYANDNTSQANLLNNLFVRVTEVGDEDVDFPELAPVTDARLDTIALTVDDVIAAIHLLH